MNNYFCVLPFFGYEFYPNGGSHCCLLPKNYQIDTLRQDILDDKRSEFCSACWKLEDAGFTSDRMLKNSALDFYWDRDIRFIEEDVKQGKYKTLMVKNITSNTCNSTCITCNSGASTAWAPLEKKMLMSPQPSKQMSKERIDQNLNFQELISLNFIGGEPLYEKLNFYILEKLVEHGNTKCFLQFTTNGSVAFSQEQKALLNKFSNINVNISIDGIGPVFKYMRYPLNWDTTLDNLDFFRSITNNVSVSYTISNLNVFYHLSTVEWLRNNGLAFIFNPVINPSYFSPAALPLHVKQKIIQDSGQHQDLVFFLGNEHTEKHDSDFNKMLSVIAKQDQAKGISIKNYLPDLASLLNL